MSMKNPNDTIGFQTRYLPSCGAVPPPSGAPRVPNDMVDQVQNVSHKIRLTSRLWSLQCSLHKDLCRPFKGNSKQHIAESRMVYGAINVLVQYRARKGYSLNKERKGYQK